MSDYDSFDDVLHSEHHTGIFGSSEAALGNALAEHLKVTTTPIEDGLALEFGCEGCKQKVRLTLDYPEVVALNNGVSPKMAFAQNVPLLVPDPQSGRPRANGSAAQLCRAPTDWVFHKEEGAWGPNLRCRCGWGYQIRVQPREIDALLRRAKQAGYLDQASAAADYHCKAFRAAAQGHR